MSIINFIVCFTIVIYVLGYIIYGFYNKMNEKKLEKILKNKKISSDLIQEYCEQFINQIKDSGERDNITLIIAKLNIYKKGYFGRIKSILNRGR